ncbi:hypothetical protein X560_0202 [Listeria fleischmannii 1991]|uniref:Protein of uncharacterized function DUF2620 n=2 Tax=Listeria fleischmannii TaxID=1069827 RepID=A0A2X3ITV8_9LIST|nr:DUF2620 domain-containing protein [Listeria fleischmannii]EMG26946.1 hypothetical protein LFLEISCH_13702 [Listeria fleischmannii subsp. fleischmannii LU2006-1]KMT61135.1 hypothetical protein X560_0202 [Listeria fleischmannii 1991]SQC65030.1 Protein of uncharacterised function DUF2620 [Listeria fleischmannii subsp. fleischmannii]
MTKKIAIGGQLGKVEIEKVITEIAGGQLEFVVKSDLDAAMALKNGEVDYYVGACETGSGGALAMAIALVGASHCVTIASPSSVMTSDEILEQVKNGKTAFGFTKNSIDQVLPVLIKALI